MDELDDLTWPSACAYMCEVYNYANNLRKSRHLDPELIERMQYPTTSPLPMIIKPVPIATARTRRERRHAKAKSPHSLVAMVQDATSVVCHVSRDAHALMYIHSFLCHNEVIGWLGGHTNGDDVDIACSFPVKACGHTENPNINVEMDIEDAFAVKEEMQQMGLTIVGWYHSHPTFENTPSIVDIENQLSHQKACDQRFLGTIVSPYWCSSGTLTLPKLCTFIVEEDNEHFLTYEHHPACEVRHEIYGEVHEDMLLSKAKELLLAYATHPKRVNFKAVWKRGITHEEKLRQGLSELVSSAFAAEVIGCIHNYWPEDSEPAKSKRPKTHRCSS